MTRLSFTVPLTVEGADRSCDSNERLIKVDSRERAERRWRAKRARENDIQRSAAQLLARLESLALEASFEPFKPEILKLARRIKAVAKRTPEGDRIAVMHAVCRFGCFTVSDVTWQTKLPRADVQTLLEALATEGLISRSHRPVPCSTTREIIFTPIN